MDKVIELLWESNDCPFPGEGCLYTQGDTEENCRRCIMHRLKRTSDTASAFDHYQSKARKSANLEAPKEKRILNWCFGIMGEAGEVIDTIKKHLFHKHEAPRTALMEELGDLLWYISNLAYEYKISLDELAYNNVSKLKKRYPQGFSPERSVNRDDK